MRNFILFCITTLISTISILSEGSDLTIDTQKKYLPTTLLHSCWKSDELKGTLEDRFIAKTFSDHSPPKYQKPRITNEQLDLNKSIRSVSLPENEKYVAITFDLCEQANEKTGYDSKIINYLRDNQVPATLFAGGKWMRSHQDKTKQLMADPLFELGNHTWTHGNLRVIHGKELEEQILWTQAQYEILRDELLNSQCAAPFKKDIELSVPPIPKLFRFPYGTCDKESLATVNNQGLYPIQWNIVSGDPSKKQSADAITKTILNQIKPGSIIVAHANGRGWNTSEALPKVINGLRNLGYKFVKVSDLLKMGDLVSTDTCYEIKPNDNIRYDKLFGKGTE
jgi:peptidoglycan/xylan/chitin deacetylase (PgdA/CDA1 family)